MGNLRGTAKKSYGSRARWDEDFKDEQFKIPGKPTRVRLFNEVVPVPMHYVEFHSKNKGGKTGFYELCCNWDFDNEAPTERGCPMCENGIRTTTYSYGYLISRTEQKKGNLQVRPVRLTPKHTSDIVKLSDTAYEDGEAPEGWDDDELPDATDPKFGFDIMISVENNNNKTEYKATVPIKSPLVSLKKDEYRAFKDYVNQVNFGELAKKGQPKIAEVQKKLESLGLIEGSGDSGGKSLGKKAKSKARSEEDYDAYDDEVPDDEDDPVDPAPKKKASKKKAAKKVAAVGEDDDEDDDLPWDEEDDDGEVEKSYATADEDDAPDEDDEDEDYEDED